MENLDGYRSEPGSSLQAAVAAANASRTEEAGLVMSERTQLVLEVLMVLMCLGAVTGTDLPVIVLF